MKKLFVISTLLVVLPAVGEAPRQLYKKDGQMVWASRSGGTAPGWYVALFNTGEAAQEVAVDFVQLGVRGKVAVRDCRKQADEGVFSRRYSRMIPPHGAVLVKKKINKSSK
jgi:alpha-galactosidase